MKSRMTLVRSLQAGVCLYTYMYIYIYIYIFAVLRGWVSDL
jgi:hypothetical protein